LRRNKRVTIVTIAEACGITDGTVSRALRNDPRVRPETRAKVLEVARRLGYRPHLQARALKLGRTGLIAVISDSGSWIFYNDYFGRLLAGLAEAAEADGQRLLFSLPRVRRRDDNPMHDEVQLGGLADLGDGRVDGGLVLGGRRPQKAELRQLRESGVPVVWVSPNETIPGFSQLLSGSRRRAESAGRLLAAQGHRRVLFLGLYEDSTYHETSLVGLKTGLGASAKILAAALDHWDLGDPVRLLPHLERGLRHGCTAVLCSNYEQGQVLLDLALGRGLRVPDDLSLLVFGPVAAGQRARPLPLSCLDSDLIGGGRRAYGLLRRAMAGEPLAQIELEWELLPGGATLGPVKP
jgi:LacI family transcriptional regulator